MSKKVVINALQYKNNSSGIGVVVRDLFSNFTKCTDRQCSVLLMKDAPEFPCSNTTKTIHVPVRYADGIKRVLYRFFKLGKYAENSILLTTDASVPLFLPKSCEMLPLVSDLALYHMPEVYKKSRVLLWKFQYSIPFKQARHFLAVSEFTKQDMADTLHIPKDKIYVVYNSCSDAIRRLDAADIVDKEILECVRAKYKLPENYVLFIGNNNPRKNLHRIIRAFDLIKDGDMTDGEIKLVIAGEQGWKFDKDDALADIKHKDDISFIGFVPDEDMSALYTMASLFAFPTLYEGFGIPVIEAQRCGVPVLTSNVTALPEVGGEGACYADPYDINDIAACMSRILRDDSYRVELVEKGYSNCERFSWQKSAERLDEIIDLIEKEND